ncbi:MAG: thiamine phosphate synthase, partial [Planctomycetes bacterium]|nr:thiamine phosphate synthase [Planctomycetota bacterium]
MNTHALRLIDANANRAREALRVMEDAARFVLNDPAISERAKQMRHDLAEALRPVDGLALHRDTPRDVGASLATTAESRRDRIDDVAIAAGKRLSEALRCIEEYAKTSGHDRDVAPRIEKLRYRGYELETLLNRRLAMPDPRTWRVCVIITESLCTRHGWLDVARAALEGGAQCIQLREKELESAALHDRAARLL